MHEICEYIKYTGKLRDVIIHTNPINSNYHWILYVCICILKYLLSSQTPN